MVKNSFKKLVATLSAVAMTATLFVPAVSAVELSKPVTLDAVVVATPATLGADENGVISTTKTDIEYESAACSISGDVKLTFDMTIETPLKDGCYQNGTNGVTSNARRTLDSFAIRFDNGSDPAGALQAKLYDAATDSMSFCWKAGNDTAGSFNHVDGGEFKAKLGEKYTYEFTFTSLGTTNVTAALNIFDKDGTLVSTTEGLDMRQLKEKGKAIGAIYMQKVAREAGVEANVTLSDFVTYTKTGADEIDVTAKGVILTEGGETVEDAVLKASENDTFYIPSSGGSFDLESVVLQGGG